VASRTGTTGGGADPASSCHLVRRSLDDLILCSHLSRPTRTHLPVLHAQDTSPCAGTDPTTETVRFSHLWGAAPAGKYFTIGRTSEQARLCVALAPINAVSHERPGTPMTTGGPAVRPHVYKRRRPHCVSRPSHPRQPQGAMVAFHAAGPLAGLRDKPSRAPGRGFPLARAGDGDVGLVLHPKQPEPSTRAGRVGRLRGWRGSGTGVPPALGGGTLVRHPPVGTRPAGGGRTRRAGPRTTRHVAAPRHLHTRVGGGGAGVASSP